MSSEKTVKALADHVAGHVEGDEDLLITGAATLGDAGQGDVSFLANPRYEKQLKETKASAVVVGEDVPANGRTLIRSSDPYYAFMQIVVLLYGHREHKPVGISPNAKVSESATLGRNVDVHDFVRISDDVRIGDNTRIYSNCTIGPRTHVGSDCVIYPNVTIYDGCTLGDRVTIHAGSVVGQDGCGYATHDGVHHKIPQIGAVILEDDVEIGANCAVDRGTLSDTVIGKGTKFGNHINIGHGTKIGPHCLLVAQSAIAGSVEVGHHCVFAGQVGVVGHIKIGNGVKIGAQAGVTNSIPDGESVVGSPAMPLTQAKRSLLAVKNLPELRQKLRELERTIRKSLKGK